ncbi:hypothetical protein DFH09DRAFT_1097053 [Mycena vulgaris]|nr:hypothetical protein DFH09DRAFT_1097053 [Mycena vulgaris]
MPSTGVCYCHPLLAHVCTLTLPAVESRPMLCAGPKLNCLGNHYCFDIAELYYHNTILAFYDALLTGGGLAVLEFSSFVGLECAVALSTEWIPDDRDLCCCPPPVYGLDSDRAQFSGFFQLWPNTLKFSWNHTPTEPDAFDAVPAKCRSTVDLDPITQEIHGFPPSSALSPLSSPLPNMSSLTRQRTLDSVRSWWSDSNPTGPNINLHALAKPLMKLMYHRQALDYITEHDSKPLSRDDMEIYASYLGFKYVSSATKIAVLTALITKAGFQDNAETVVDCIILYPLDILLESRNAKVQGLTCDLLERLARRCPNRTAAWAASVCKQLVPLLRDENGIVQWQALSALSWMTSEPEGALAAIDAHVLDGLTELVKSPNFNVRARTRELLGELVSHKAVVPRILGTNFCELLVALLRWD